ncbi:DUF4097 family beta strand repeat protein [Candidatus Dependentiae bacterium]|nr:DUF4097 family beta strand repeat protein [Candidatus Dependentiae bacterium]
MMKRFIILLSLITLLSLPLFGEEKVYEQSKLKRVKINFGKIIKLSIISPKGSIQLIKSKDEVIVNAVFTITSNSKDSLKSSLDLSSIDIRKDKDKIIIEAKVPRNYVSYNQVILNQPEELENAVRKISKKKTDFDAVTVDFYVTIPEKIKFIYLENSSGSIDISGISSDLKINSKHGELNIENVKGDIDIKHSYGDITLIKIDGDISLDNSHGRVFIKQANNITVKNSYKAVLVEEVEGDISIENKNADVKLKKVRLHKTKRDSTKRVKVQNRTGNIIIYPEKKPSITLKAKSNSGLISCDYPIQSTVSDEDELSGIIGDGDVFVELETYDAEIKIIEKSETDSKKKSEGKGERSD